MPTAAKTQVLKEFQQVPGIGESIAEDLWDLGLRSISDLKRSDPQALYDRRCKQQGVIIDRCLLYTFRCAVYYASTPKPNPKLLKWWNWKDKKPVKSG